MVESLQELVDLYMYNSTDDVPVCEVVFKGRFEPFAIISVEQLLSELLTRKVKKECSSDDLTGEPVFVSAFDETELNNSCVSGVVKVICECNTDSVELHEKLLQDLTYIAAERLPLSLSAYHAIVFSNGFYTPPGEIYDAMGIPDGKHRETLVYREIEPLNVVNVMKEGSFSKYGFHYSCGNYREIVLSLIHYAAIVGKPVKRCERCGRWFFPKKKIDEKYCAIKYGEKSCKEWATEEKRRQRLQDSPVQKKYNSVNTKLKNRVDAVADEAERAQRLKVLCDFRNEWQEIKGIYTKDQLMKWLEQF